MKKALLLLLISGCILHVMAQTGAWTQKSDIGSLVPNGPRGTIESVGFAIGNKGYVGTGFALSGNAFSYTKQFEAYDPVANRWLARAGFGGTARSGAAGFSIGGKGYIGTGSDTSHNTFLSDFWAYDSLTDTWSQKADFAGYSRTSAIGFSIGGTGYIGTGFHNTQVLGDFWAYDTAANAWTRKADFGGGLRYAAVAFSIGNKGYVGTGNNPVDTGTPDFYSDFWEYDPATDTWTQKANFGGGTRAGAVAFSIGNLGYLGTGNAGIASDGISTEGQKDFWQYDPSSDTWTQKADFAGALRYYATGWSAAGKGYIGMGYSVPTTGPTIFEGDFWQYDPSGDTWHAITGFEPQARPFATTFTIGKYGYLGFGGTADFWQYDTAANIWTQKASFPGPERSAAAGFAVGNQGYVATGQGYFNAIYNDCWQYDPSANAWTARANFPGAARMQAIAFGIGSKGYLGTGTTDPVNNLFAKDFWEYDPAADSWSQKTDFAGGARSAAVGLAIGAKGYVGTGVDTGTVTGFHALVDKKDFWQYDPASDTWTQKANFGGGDRTYATGFSAGGKGYIGTGMSDTTLNSLQDFWQYDTAADTWTRIPDLPGQGREYAAAFSIGPAGYAGSGGIDGSSLLNDWWKYDPSAAIIRTALGTYQISSVCPGITGTGFIWEADNLGGLVLGIDPGANNLGATCWGTNTLSSAYRDTYGWFGGAQPAYGAYLPRNYVLTPSTEPTSNVTLRLYCTDQELTDFVSYFNSRYGTAYTQSDIRVIRYDGANQDLDLTNNSAVSTDYTALIPSIGLYGNANEYRYFEVTTPRLSEFAITLSSPSGPLGFTLLDFTAVYNAPATALGWQTTSEENTASFHIQRSTDGQTFTTIGSLPAAGNSNTPIQYHFTDPTAEQSGANTLYYRLEETDLDGRLNYSPVAVISIESSAGLTVYPDPATDHAFLQLSSAAASKAGLTVTDAEGRTIARELLYVQKGNNTIYLNTERWARGLYYVNLTTEGSSWQTKLIRQ